MKHTHSLGHAAMTDMDEVDTQQVACVLTFNANDPSGAGGLAADISTISSIGAHPLSVVTGSYLCDISQTVRHFPISSQALQEQACIIAQDAPIQMIKLGFLGSAENVRTVARLLEEHKATPVVAYVCDLPWTSKSETADYFETLREHLLPRVGILIGNYDTLANWLMPENAASPMAPTPLEIAQAANRYGVAYTLVTGITCDEAMVDNVLCSAEHVLIEESFPLLECPFSRTGDTLSAALTAMIATGSDLVTATQETLCYMQRCLEEAFSLGSGKLIPDRMFWAQSIPTAADEPHLPDPFEALDDETQH